MTATHEADDATAALENQFGLADRIVDEASLANSVERFRERGIVLPTFAQLADPASFDQTALVGDADPQGPDARNEMACAVRSQAYFAQTALEIGEQEYLKIMCIHTSIGRDNVG